MTGEAVSQAFMQRTRVPVPFHLVTDPQLLFAFCKNVMMIFL